MAKATKSHEPHQGPADAILLAGGFGTRLKAITGDLPKPMVSVLGIPVLFRQIHHLQEQNIHRILVIAGYRGEFIKEGVAKEFGDAVEVRIESIPLGTGGCLNMAKDWLHQRTFVISADMLFEYDLGRIVRFHQRHSSKVTLAVHPNSHPRDSDLVLTDSASRVTALLTRPHPESLVFQNQVNASVTLVEPEVMEFVKAGMVQNFEKDIVSAVLKRLGGVWAYNTSEYLRDIGTPERLLATERDLKNGLPRLKSLKHRQKAVFLAIDKVLNDRSLLIAAVPSLAHLNASPWLAIALHKFGEEDSREAQCDTLFAEHGLWINHHMRCSGNLVEWEMELESCLDRFNIDLAESAIWCAEFCTPSNAILDHLRSKGVKKIDPTDSSLFLPSKNSHQLDEAPVFQ